MMIPGGFVDTILDDKRPPVRSADIVAGASLGAFLGTLIGLAGSNVVSTVISAFVALLAGFFGLQVAANMSAFYIGANRLAAFALAATLMLPTAIWVRAHNILGISAEQRGAQLEKLGFQRGSRDYADILRYDAFGLLPSGSEAKKKDTKSTVLYSEDTNLCDELATAKTPEDTIEIMKGAGQAGSALALSVKALSPEARRYAKEYFTIFSCNDLTSVKN